MTADETTASRQQGFTLIELSIVLVIIGLLVGGVMVGKDLIKSAQIKKGLSELEKIGAAVNTFKVKYNCIPGDCKNITEIFPTGIYGGNGNGDGFINNWPNETYGAMDSLVLANLAPRGKVKIAYGHAQSRYMSCYNDGYAYLYFADLYSISSELVFIGGHPWILPNATKKGLTYTCATYDNNNVLADPVITPNDALIMDTKLDDGLPQTGKFLSQNSAGLCTVAAQNAYLGSNTLGCRFVYYLPVGN
jgi:prepilin-type N-terminal cleavage/methylation domain-containing protein